MHGGNLPEQTSMFQSLDSELADNEPPCSCPSPGVFSHRRRSSSKLCRKEDEAELSSCKPQLSLMRDRDKRFGAGVPAVPSSSSSSMQHDSASLSPAGSLFHKGQQQMSNDPAVANNCPMAPLKYLRPSVYFPAISSLSLSSWSCCDFCGVGKHYSRYYSSFSFHNDNNKNVNTKTSPSTKRKLSLPCWKEMKRTGEERLSSFPRTFTLLIFFAIFSQIVFSANGSPIVRVPHQPPQPPTQNQTTMVINKQSPIEGDINGLSPPSLINNTLLMMEKDSSEQIRSDEEHSSMRNSSESDSDSVSSSGRINFKFMPDNNHFSARGRNRSTSEKGAGGVSEKPGPLALKMRTETLIIPPPSSVSSSLGFRQRVKGMAPVTNDLSHEAGFDDDDDMDDEDGAGNSIGFAHVISDDNGRGNDSYHNSTRDVDSESSPGLCWFYALSSNEEDDASRETAATAEPTAAFLMPVPTAASPVGALCNGTTNLALTLQQIPDSLVSQVISLRIKDSSISTLNLSLFNRFPRLTNLSVTHSNVSHIIGTCPKDLLALNISFNALKRIDNAIFHGRSTSSSIGNTDVEYYSNEANEQTGKASIEFTGNGNISVEKLLYFPSPAKNSSKKNNPQQPHSNKSEYSPTYPKSSNGNLSPLSRFNREGTSHEKLVMVGSTPPAPTRATKFATENRKRGSANDVQRKEGSPFSGEGGESNLHQPLRKRRRVSPADVLIQARATANERNDDGDDYHQDDYELEAAIKAAKEGDNDPDIISSGEEKISSSSSGGAGADKEITGGVFDDSRNINGLRNSTTGAGKDFRNEQSSEPKSESYTGSEENVDYFHPTNVLSTSADIITPVGTSSSGNKQDEIKVGRGRSTSSPLKEKVQRGTIKKRSISSGSGGSDSIGVGALSLEDVDLSHNKLSEVPSAVLELTSLKSLRLSGNQLKCDFVWEKLADWYMTSEDPNILKDGDDTFCGVVDDVRVFQFTVLGVLKAKKDVVETCSTVDKTICHECGLYSLNKQPGYGYNLSHQSPRGNVAIALKLDCSLRNLTDLPPVPPQTWQLNVSGNSIKDLSPLKEPMYENLLILDADTNEISSLDGLTGTPFLDKYNYLSLQNNQFSVIPSNILSSLKNMRGQGITFFGANFIDCDCEVVKEIKPLLLENSKQIKDLKEIYCKDMKTPKGDSYIALKNLQYTDLCYLDTAESNEMYLYLVIFVELLLIFVIVAKVWHDQRTFRRTGILPWCSAKMPRLPCDAMLESVKEPPHFNRSSSSNVRSLACDHATAQTISSHVQLREVRSNSGQSEKSSQISQLSSFPSSSRTSSV